MKRLILQIIHLLFVSSVFGLSTERPCNLKKLNDGYVCVCTDSYCDSLNVPKLSNESEWMIVTSTKSGQRFNISLGSFQSTPQDMNQCNTCTNTTKNVIEIDRTILHQKIIGFGGSITGAVSHILNQLSENLRECIYKSYYSTDYGIGYSIIRMPIGGCDFDLEPWTYNEYPENDIQLTNFTQLHPVDESRTALIRDLMNVTGQFDIKIVGATWSPPRWMKMRGEWPGTVDNQLKLEYYQTWADYHSRWLDLMYSAGIPIWAISTGNEPYFAQNTPFVGLYWNASMQSKWIGQYLGPTLKKSKYANVKIHAFDDNRNMLLSWLNEMNTANNKTLDYISSIGVHGYFDKVTSPDVLVAAKQQFPNKNVLYTEMCFGVTGPVSTTVPVLGSWINFEKLTFMLMETLMHGVNGYIDWNIILDTYGGPNYINNTVDAFMIANDDFTEIYKQPLFYAAAHFAKFILPGSKRIETTIVGDNATELNSLAFLRNDNHIAAIFYNKHPHKSISLTVIDKLKGKICIEIESNSLNSLIYMI